MTHIPTQNLRKTTLFTGLCFLILVVTGPIGLMLMPEQIFVADNATQTLANLTENSDMFFYGVGAQVAIFLTEIVLSCLLYVLTKPISQTFALIALAARLTMTVIIGTNIVPLLGAYHIATTDYATLPVADLSNLMFNLHTYGTLAWQFAFALHLIFLGYLVFNSTYLPRLIGVALFIGGFGYMADSLGRILGWMDISIFSLASNSLLGVAGVGEISLALWLLIKGVNLDKWKIKTLTS